MYLNKYFSFTSKDHQEKGSFSFMNNAKFLSWNHKNYSRMSDADFFVDNRAILTENLGQHNFSVVSDNLIWNCWAVSFQGTIFLIFSSKASTKYEIVYNDSWIKFSSDTNTGDLIIKFNYWLAQNIFN